MLPDPITIAAAAPTPQLVFAKTRTDGYGSEAIDSGGNGYATFIQHTPSANGNRHYIRITRTVNATNPYTAAVSKQNASVSMSVSRPAFGYTDADMIALITLLRDYIFDTEVTPTKIVQLQS